MEVEPRFKEITDCPCGCGLSGALVLRKFKDGTRHVRGCKCKQCRGRRNRSSGLAAQRKAAKALMVPQVGWSRPGDEENWAGSVRAEVKSGAQVKPLHTAWAKAAAQSEAARPIGDTRPFVMVARVSPTGKDGLVILQESQLREVVYTLAEAFFGDEP